MRWGRRVPDINRHVRHLPTEYPRNLALTHLNVISIRHKFYEIYGILNGNGSDICSESETKIDEPFTKIYFYIPGVKLYRQNR